MCPGWSPVINERAKHKTQAFRTWDLSSQEAEEEAGSGVKGHPYCILHSRPTWAMGAPCFNKPKFNWLEWGNEETDWLAHSDRTQAGSQ